LLPLSSLFFSLALAAEPIANTHLTVVDTVGAAAPPAGSKVVDGPGRFLIPGLWDMPASL